MDRTIVTGAWPGGQGRILSVLVGRTYTIGPRGDAELQEGEFRLREEPEHLEDLPTSGRARPSLLRRDADCYVFRDFTDLVVQGTVRTDRAVRSTEVALTCRGHQTDIAQTVVVTGDRRVERGTTGPRLSEPVPFTEMPLRYDKAYGGTDELAEERHADPELAELAEALGPEVLAEFGEFSYPRNPAGKGFLVEPDGLIGLAWPNVELLQHRLPTTDLERLAQPMDRWGDRPYPAGFDWFPHEWFPRIAFFGVIPETHDGRVPEAEVKLGLLRADEARYPLADRAHRFAQGAHPFLYRNRLRGGERITVTSFAPEGQDLVVIIPDHRPRVHVSLFGAAEQEVAPLLDRVFVEGDERRVTLLWRASVAAGREHLPAEWRAKCPYRIDWE
ncbi:DUF2169 domain-containing protein [Sorangium sp. So ce131]|uniref:DUF2169 domain-containing protein n=1 Tax=Sorangium sp. So ce131 TaxID=3133282 RepID=UPI003F6027A2